MKKFLSIVMLVLVACCLLTACGEKKDYSASVDSGDVAKLTLFTYDGKSESVWGLANLGHSFLSIENISSQELNVHKKSLDIGETLVLGTWSIQAHFGVWYNVESNYIREHNKYDGRVSITIGISLEDLDNLSDLIEDNDRWNPINNCSYFALKLFNKVATDTEKIKTPLIHTPSYIAEQIKCFDNYEINKDIPNLEKMGYFDGDKYITYDLQKAEGV